MKLSARQAEVLANLSLVTSHGSRHAALYRLCEKNVSVQVRSLLAFGIVKIEDGRLINFEQTLAGQQPPRFDAQPVVVAMRDLLGERGAGA